jgi:N-acetylmuramoyl-L-alanine amidase
MRSPNASSRFGARPHFVVLHYTGMADGQSALEKLCDPDPRLGRYRHALPPAWKEGPDDQPLGQTSAHYLIDETGRTHALVPEELAAWHAGESWWRGVEGLNRQSIGIELVNGGHDYGLPDFPQVQIDQLKVLLRAIMGRWPNIAESHVIAHRDIAPERKLDPGPKFPWAALVQAGLATRPLLLRGRDMRVLARPGQHHDAIEQVARALEAVGYLVDQGNLWTPRNAAALAAWAEHYGGDSSGVSADTPLRAWHLAAMRKQC